MTRTGDREICFVVSSVKLAVNNIPPYDQNCVIVQGINKPIVVELIQRQHYFLDNVLAITFIFCLIA